SQVRASPRISTIDCPTSSGGGKMKGLTSPTVTMMCQATMMMMRSSGVAIHGSSFIKRLLDNSVLLVQLDAQRADDLVEFPAGLQIDIPWLGEIHGQDLVDPPRPRGHLHHP